MPGYIESLDFHSPSSLTSNSVRDERTAARLAAGQLVVVVGPAVGVFESHALALEEVDHLRSAAQERLATRIAAAGSVIASPPHSKYVAGLLERVVDAMCAS